MRFFILLCYLIVHIVGLNAQDHKYTQYHFTGATEKLLEYEAILGSPYYYEEFNDGDVFFLENDTSVKYRLNYNAYTDAVEFLKDKKAFTVINPYEIKKIFLNNDTIVYINYYNQGSISKGFFIEIIDSQISLYKRETVIYAPAKGTSFQISKNNSGKFVRLKTKYYISILGCPAFLVQNKKNIVSKFSNNPVVIDYLKKGKINVHSENDLKKFAEYINHYRTR
ncbi:hypothetical protein ACFLS4_02220 [Bacteroidota bacterium]